MKQTVILPVAMWISMTEKAQNLPPYAHVDIDGDIRNVSMMQR